MVGISTLVSRITGLARDMVYSQMIPVALLDAFLVANWALSMAGEAFITCAPQVEPEKPKRSRKAA